MSVTIIVAGTVPTERHPLDWVWDQPLHCGHCATVFSLDRHAPNVERGLSGTVPVGSWSHPLAGYGSHPLYETTCPTCGDVVSFAQVRTGPFWRRRWQTWSHKPFIWPRKGTGHRPAELAEVRA